MPCSGPFNARPIAPMDQFVAGTVDGHGVEGAGHATRSPIKWMTFSKGRFQFWHLSASSLATCFLTQTTPVSMTNKARLPALEESGHTFSVIVRGEASGHRQVIVGQMVRQRPIETAVDEILGEPDGQRRP